MTTTELQFKRKKYEALAQIELIMNNLEPEDSYEREAIRDIQDKLCLLQEWAWKDIYKAEKQLIKENN